MRALRDPQRLWDLVRFFRCKALEKGLITQDEYAELAEDHLAVARLEQDDADMLRAERGMTTPAEASGARYSGPGRTGTCVCGHRWDEHHLGVVMNREHLEATGEAYVPQECEHYGFNETGGLMPGEGGAWEDHCHGYRDAGEAA